MMMLNMFEEALDPASSGLESMVDAGARWIVLVAEGSAAAIILLGIILTLAKLVRSLRQPNFERYEKARLSLARFLALALEFQLAADVVATAVSPSWNQIGKLGAIAVVRTALNYFLSREIKEEEKATSETAIAESRT